jgi:predicted  nucleic acid-binding Zn-ribbon protein
LAQETERGLKEATANLEQLKHRLDALDRRLDDIDTMVSAIAERAMKRPLSLTIQCPNCGRIVEIGIVGSEKMMK